MRANRSAANPYTYADAMHGEMYAYAQAASDSTAAAQSIAK